MRGYNTQTSNVDSQDSFLAKNIENYTIKDCEDFLAKYSNDLDADKVRERLQKLKKHNNGVINVSEQPASENRPEQHQKNLTHSAKNSNKDTKEPAESITKSAIRIFWCVVFVLLCLFFGFLIIGGLFNKEAHLFYNYSGDFLWSRFAGSVLVASSALGWVGKQTGFNN